VSEDFQIKNSLLEIHRGFGENGLKKERRKNLFKITHDKTEFGCSRRKFLIIKENKLKNLKDISQKRPWHWLEIKNFYKPLKIGLNFNSKPSLYWLHIKWKGREDRFEFLNVIEEMNYSIKTPQEECQEKEAAKSKISGYSNSNEIYLYYKFSSYTWCNRISLFHSLLLIIISILD